LSVAGIDRGYAEQLTARGPEEARLVSFGRKFVLVGADIRSTASGLRIELAWHSLATQRLQYYNIVQLWDGAGNLVGRADYPQDRVQNEVQDGALWRDVIIIPPEKLKGADTLAFGLFQPPSSWLTIDNSSSGQKPRWLLLPLPKSELR
jgi:hypothetical protein